MDILFVLLTALIDYDLTVSNQWMQNLKNCDIDSGYTYTVDNDHNFITEYHNKNTMNLVTDIQVYYVTNDGTDICDPKVITVYKHKYNDNYYIRYTDQLNDN